MGGKSKRLMGMRRAIPDKNQLHGESPRSFCLHREFGGGRGVPMESRPMFGLAYLVLFPSTFPFWPFSENTSSYLILDVLPYPQREWNL